MSRFNSLLYPVGLAVLLGAAFVLATALVSSAGPKPKLTVTRGKEIKFEHPLRLPQELQWIVEKVLAVHPDGQRVALLLPQPKPPDLQPRPEHGQAERIYRLAWISLDTGEVERSRELNYRRRILAVSPPLVPHGWPGNAPDGEKFGFALAPGGDHLCTIAGGDIVVLDLNLEIVARRPSRFADSDGKQWRAGACSFFPDAPRLLITLWEDGVSFSYAKSKLLVYDWQEEIPLRIAHVEGYTFDAVALADQRSILTNLEAGFAWRYRIAEVSLNEESPGVLWQTYFRENAGKRLVVTRNYVFRGESPWVSPGDHALYTNPLEDLADFYDLPPITASPSPGVIGRIRFWNRYSGKPEPEISLRGYVLLWPIAVSPDERWLAVRAVHYNEIVGKEPFWDDNRFVIVSVENPKKPLYVSENFGRGEAVTGLAFTPDGLRLIVSTTARLLIYNIKETPASQ